MHARLSLLATACLVAGCKGDSTTTDKADPPRPSGNPSGSGESAPKPTSTGLPTQTVGAEADCSTFSVADIERIWGPGVQPPAPGGTNKVTELTGPGTLRWSCKYEYSDANGLVVRVDYRVHADEAAAKGSFAGIVSGETSLAKREPDRVDLGDEAIVTAPAPKDVQRQIYVRKGQVIFLLGALNMKTGAGADFTDKLQKTYKLRF